MKARQHNGGALPYITVEPDAYTDGDHYPLVVLLHGFGANMSDLASLAPAIDQTGYVYAFPNAPHRLEMGFGAAGFAWATYPPRENDPAFAESDPRLKTFIDEVMGQLSVSDGQIVLGGFSQGGMMTLRIGLSAPERFRGLAVLSGRLPDEDALDDPTADPSQAVFIAHGSEDEVLSVKDGRQTRDYLEQHGYAPEYHEYAMGHAIDPEELADLTRWLHTTLPPAQ